jgi:hypothetical protein
MARPTAITRKRAMVEGLQVMHWDRFRASGAGLMMGEGHFILSEW